MNERAAARWEAQHVGAGLQRLRRRPGEPRMPKVSRCPPENMPNRRPYVQACSLLPSSLLLGTSRELSRTRYGGTGFHVPDRDLRGVEPLGRRTQRAARLNQRRRVRQQRRRRRHSRKRETGNRDIRRGRRMEERDLMAGTTEKSAFYHIIQLVWLWSGGGSAASVKGTASQPCSSWIGAAHTLMLRHSHTKVKRLPGCTSCQCARLRPIQRFCISEPDTEPY